MLTTIARSQMKSIVQAVLSAMGGIGAALGLALYPIAQNPHLVWMYTALAVAISTAAVVFWLSFRRYNAGDSEMNKRDLGGNTNGSNTTRSRTDSTAL
jgi:POT family proton-dependent oligopeptide transporter